MIIIKKDSIYKIKLKGIYMYKRVGGERERL
jgi:hypothetical protein